MKTTTQILLTHLTNLLRRNNMGIEHIKEQTLRHISSLTRYLDMSDEDRLKAYEWIYVVLWDYHRLHGPYEYISLGDVSYFFDIWYEDTYGDVADEDRCMCGLPLEANGRNCYSHMTRGY